MQLETSHMSHADAEEPDCNYNASARCEIQATLGFVVVAFISVSSGVCRTAVHPLPLLELAWRATTANNPERAGRRRVTNPISRIDYLTHSIGEEGKEFALKICADA